MGFFTDNLEAEVNDRHFAVRTIATVLGAQVAFHVDGRKVDEVSFWLFDRGTLSATVDGELVIIEAVIRPWGCRYRLFVGDLEVQLRLEAGESGLGVFVPLPRFAEVPVRRALPPGRR
ncbi:MAG: hypothetical protein U0228_06730 [Myxococcaceae bacterium]